MKKFTTTTLIFGLLLTFLGCTRKQDDQLTQQQKELIKKEIKMVWDSILVRWTRLDAEGSLQYFSPELNVVEGDLRRTFEEYRKAWIDYDKTIASDKVTSIREDYFVCSKDLVITTWLIKDNVYMKSGDRITINPITYTLVFRNFGGQWKGIYSHISGNPTIQKAEQK